MNHNRMQSTALLIVILSSCVFAENPFTNDVQLKVTKDQSSFTFPIENVSPGTHLSIKTRLLKGAKVNIAVLLGSQTESWTLNQEANFSAITLCHEETDLTSLHQIHFMIHRFDPSIEEHIIELSAKWEDISLKLGGVSDPIEINPQFPVTFLIDHTSHDSFDRKNRFVLNVETTDRIPKSDEICMIVAVYNQECPLHNRPNNVRSAEMWTTALKSATLTIRADKFCFSSNFYVSVVVLPSDYDCLNFKNYGDECHSSQAEILTNKNGTTWRQKEITVRIDLIKPYTEYVMPIIVPVVCIIIMIFISCCTICNKSYGDVNAVIAESPEQEVPEEVKSEVNSSEEETKFVDARDELDGNGTGLHPCEAAYDFCNGCAEKVKERENALRIRQGLRRMKDAPKVSDNVLMRDKDSWFRRTRSKVYFYLVILISMFYFVPAIQFAFQAKESEEVSGSMDLCYHNFKCARPFWIFSDFNHVFSNISYVIYGVSFMIIAYIKTTKLPEKNHPRNDHLADTGLQQQMSIFYAMGFSLMAQGFFSICYHVCPTNLTLQFDTTMMYTICILCFVKMYQFRHPDATANAFATIGLLAFIVWIEALALYSDSWIVYGIFLACYMGMTIFIAFDCYYLGIGRADYIVALALAKEACFNWKPVTKPTPQDEIDANQVAELIEFTKKRWPKWVKYPRRFFFAVVFVSINVLHAIYIIFRKYHNPQKNVTHVVLNILALNLILYLIYYLIRKKVCGIWCCRGCKPAEATHETFGQYCKSLWSPGTMFTLLAIICACFALYCYRERSAYRNLTPAQSRNLNKECGFGDFYDHHDIWHFTSAAAIFMAFMSLLTIDDDLLTVPRDKIDVF